MKCQQRIITEYTNEWEREKEERMGMRKTVRKENKTGTVKNHRTEEFRRNQCSADGLL